MISISESEWQVMQAVWSGPPKTLPEILSSLQAPAGAKPPSKPTWPGW